MAASDEALRAVFNQLAGASKGRLKFRVRTVRDLGAELGLDLGSSNNPVYEFDVSPPSGASFRAIAYTIVIDGSKRPATRVEALGRGLAADGGKLFEHHPFLLVFDYVGKQFMAVSAIALFGTFAREASQRPLAKSESATFSLSPNFSKRTISLYGNVPAESIWSTPIATSTLTLDALAAGLAKLRDENVAKRSERETIVRAIESRIRSSEGTPPSGAAAGSVATVPIAGEEEPEVRLAPRVWRMVLTAIRSSSAVILVGPPGTGKTALVRKALRAISENPGLVDHGGPLQPALWATPDESWTARELVGGETIVEGAIRFRPGWVLQAIGENRWLVLDEANRADMDRIFGGLLTWLAGGSVTLGMASTAHDAPRVELGWHAGANCSTEGIEDGVLIGSEGRVRYLAGESWRMLGTYNALDAQRVFRFGAALGRRFVRVPIPVAEPELFQEALAEQAKDLPASTREGLYGLYMAHYADDATQLGPALFLAMTRYLRIAAADGAAAAPQAAAPAETTPTEADSTQIAAPDAAQALAEAYVVHVGTWLAHLDQRDLDALEKRVLASAVLTPAEWAWVATMIRALA